jgi:hypothetical protein
MSIPKFVVPMLLPHRRDLPGASSSETISSHPKCADKRLTTAVNGERNRQAPRSEAMRRACYRHLRVVFLGLLVGIANEAVAQRAEYLHFTNRVSGLCLGVRGVDDHGPGAGVEVYTCSPGGGDRGLDNQWTIEPAPGGYQYIKNRISGLCLGVRGVDDHIAGTDVEVYTCTPGGNDRGLDNQWRQSVVARAEAQAYSCNSYCPEGQTLCTLRSGQQCMTPSWCSKRRRNEDDIDRRSDKHW